MMSILSHFDPLDQQFINELPADPERKNFRRQVLGASHSFVLPKRTSNPSMISFMPEMAKNLGISEKEMQSKGLLDVLTGNLIIEGSQPFAMCYGGHQFGHWAGQLGDGRAINLGELVHDSKRWTLQLKGAGETPYSRSADGLAVLRSSIREYLCSEAMHHLGVPSTRALSLSLTGDEVLRDMLYDGNPALEKGAIVCRVSPSFLRFGNYEIFAARKDFENLKTLVDFTIRHYFNEGENDRDYGKEDYVNFFKSVVERTIDMIVHWQRVGFVHGVMNTDNMSILGLTIDYGPYGWLDNYDQGWTPNTTDAQKKRYRFGYQPSIGLWNLVRLANALFPLINDVKPLEDILGSYQETFQKQYVSMMLGKIGIREALESDESFIEKLEENLQFIETDMTIFFRSLANISSEDSPEEAFSAIEKSFYNNSSINEVKTVWLDWFKQYLKKIALQKVDDAERKADMNKINPKYVLRNYMAQMAIDLADKGDYSFIHDFQKMLGKPYEEQEEYERWFSKRPEWARSKVGCSMLSCSS